MARNPVVNLLPPNLVCEQPIFHYTSAVGFLGSVSDHALWATEAFGLNDVAELRHGWDVINQWLKEQKDNEVVDRMRAVVPSGTHPVDDAVFMCCASTEGDDASQWRLYADATRGYAIEIDPNVDLAVHARKEAFPDEVPRKSHDSTIIGGLLRDFAEVTPWMRVIYTEKQKREAISGLAHSLYGRFAAYKELLSGAESEEDYDVLRQDRDGEVRAGLAMLAQFMKAEAFQAEREVRVAATTLIDDHSYFRATAFGVVRYVKLVKSRDDKYRSRVSIDERLPLPIAGVRLGPGQVAQNSRAAARSVLRRAGYNVPIQPSTATIR
jgi:hypothetical protein